VNLTLYMLRPHTEVVDAVEQALEKYLRAMGAQALGWYVDGEGDWQELDEKGWEFIRRKFRGPRGARIELAERPEAVTGYEFRYHGITHPPEAACLLSFWLPTEYLETHGPAHVRPLLLELARELPFTSGHSGLILHYPEDVAGYSRAVRELSPRYPGMDLPESSLSLTLGTQVKGVSWLTLLGQPVLGALGGVEGLRGRLRSPGTTVEELGAERAVVTLGEWPEAGDMAEGRTLPAYRELARVLEPWLYRRRTLWSGFTEEELRRWERRFLD
jgi:hypothetical protein